MPPRPGPDSRATATRRRRRQTSSSRPRQPSATAADRVRAGLCTESGVHRNRVAILAGAPPSNTRSVVVAASPVVAAVPRQVWPAVLATTVHRAAKHSWDAASGFRPHGAASANAGRTRRDDGPSCAATPARRPARSSPRRCANITKVAGTRLRPYGHRRPLRLRYPKDHRPVAIHQGGERTLIPMQREPPDEFSIWRRIRNSGQSHWRKRDTFGVRVAFIGHSRRPFPHKTHRDEKPHDCFSKHHEFSRTQPSPCVHWLRPSNRDDCGRRRELTAPLPLCYDRHPVSCFWPTAAPGRERGHRGRNGGQTRIADRQRIGYRAETIL